MNDIPNITSAAVGVYLHQFVNWDVGKEQYVSSFCKKSTKDKQAEIQDIILLGASIAELEFLHCIEEDPRAKILFKKAINIWKKNSPF